MNEIIKDNKINWKNGDIVIHDADYKQFLNLMIVTDAERSDGLIKTEYINLNRIEPYHLNDKSWLHDPGEFGINISKSPKPKKSYTRLCKICNEMILVSNEATDATCHKCGAEHQVEWIPKLNKI